MGSWGVEPYEDDQAHDYMLNFFEGVDADRSVEEAFREFERDPEGAFPSLRAACHLLEQLGRHIVWPGKRLDELLHEGVLLLQRLANDEGIKALWADPSAFEEAVGRQIAGLERRIAHK